jgi:hypothetical protein
MPFEKAGCGSEDGGARIAGVSVVRLNRWLLAFTLLAPHVALAQTTSDGVDAFNRGDYTQGREVG